MGLVVSIAALLYAIALSLLTIAKFRAFLSTWDLGIATQYVSLFGHAKDPFSTLDGLFIFGDHVQPGLALLAPLGAVGHVAPGLLVLQAVALAAVAPILYALGRRLGVDPILAVVVPFLWLLSPVVISANLDSFHPEMLATPFIAASALAAASGRWRWFVAFALLASSFKEDICLIYIGAGLLLFLYGRRKGGVVLSAAAISWYLLCGFVIMPSLGDAISGHLEPLFSSGRGSTVFDVLWYSATHPLTTIAQMFDSNDLGILALLVLTTGGLCVLAPAWCVLAAPAIFLNFLSGFDDQHSLGHQYFIVAMAGLAIAGVVGAKRLQRSGVGRTAILRFALVAGILLATLSLGAVRTNIQAVSALDPLAQDRAAVLAAVPRKASVAAPPSLITHLAERTHVYSLPEPFGAVYLGSRWTSANRRSRVRSLRYVIIDRRVRESWGYGPGARTGRFTGPVVIARVKAAGFRAILARGPFTLYARP